MFFWNMEVFGIVIVTQMEFCTVSVLLPIFAHFWNGTFVVLWNRKADYYAQKAEMGMIFIV